MKTKTLSHHLLIALSIFENIFCAYIQGPMKFTRRKNHNNKIQKEDSGQAQTGWTNLNHISHDPYGDVPSYGSHQIHGGWESESYYDHNSYQPQTLQSVAILNEEVTKFTNEFLGVMGPLLFPVPFFLAMLPFALPAIPLAIYLETLGEQHNGNHNNPDSPHNNHNHTNHHDPHHHPNNNLNNSNQSNPHHNNPNDNHNDHNNNNPNGNNSGQMMGSHSGSGGNNSLQLPPFPMSSPSSATPSPFPGPATPGNPSFPPGPPLMMMNPGFSNSTGPSFPESPSVTNPPFPPFTTVGFNPPTNQPVDIGAPTDMSSMNTETSFNMSSLEPDLLPPITFPNGMIDATQSTPFSLFQFPIFLNSSYLDVTEK